MSIGVIIPNSGVVPTRLGIAAMAVEAEAAGAAGLWVSDHLLMVDEEIREYLGWDRYLGDDDTDNVRVVVRILAE